MKATKITYYISTGLLSALLLFSASMYLFKHADVTTAFTGLGFPTWLIYPMAIAKLLGVIALWVKAIPTLVREWAYAGIFFNVLLAAGAHLAIGDGEAGGAFLGLILVLISRFTLSKI